MDKDFKDFIILSVINSLYPDNEVEVNQSRNTLLDVEPVKNQLIYISKRLDTIEYYSGFAIVSEKYLQEFETLGEILYTLEPYKNHVVIGSLEKTIYTKYATMRNGLRYDQLIKARSFLNNNGVINADEVEIRRETRF